jgi:iron complex transport system substrate-binding protein
VFVSRPLALAALILGLGLALAFWWMGRRPLAPVGPANSAQRVILFAPNLTETACQLGLADRVVGITDYCVWPSAILDRPSVGGMVDPNLERITALDPDLLVVQGESDVLRRYARQQGLRLAEVKMDDDVASILAGFARVDSVLTGSPSRGLALASAVRAELDAIAAAVAGRPRPRTLLILGHAPGSLRDLYTMGRGSFLNELVSIAGGESMTAGHPRQYFNLSLETLLAEPPEVALELRPGEADTPRLHSEAERAWRELGLTAVRVAVVTFDGAMIPGPRIAQTAHHLQSALHPKLEPSRP